MKFINFVSKLKLENDALCLTVNVNEIKDINPVPFSLNRRTNTWQSGYFVELNSSDRNVFLNENDYKVIQEFLSNDDKYLKINVEWL